LSLLNGVLPVVPSLDAFVRRVLETRIRDIFGRQA
jgi:hypothetical protein